jgi:hypothetical protein
VGLQRADPAVRFGPVVREARTMPIEKNQARDSSTIPLAKRTTWSKRETAPVTPKEREPSPGRSSPALDKALEECLIYLPLEEIS